MAVAGAVVTVFGKLPAGRVGKNIVLHRTALARNGSLLERAHARRHDADPKGQGGI